jgi:hypothetical protein
MLTQYQNRQEKMLTILQLKCELLANETNKEKREFLIVSLMQHLLGYEQEIPGTRDKFKNLFSINNNVLAVNIKEITLASLCNSTNPQAEFLGQEIKHAIEKKENIETPKKDYRTFPVASPAFPVYNNFDPTLTRKTITNKNS